MGDRDREAEISQRRAGWPTTLRGAQWAKRKQPEVATRSLIEACAAKITSVVTAALVGECVAVPLQAVRTAAADYTPREIAAAVDAAVAANRGWQLLDGEDMIVYAP